MRRAVLGVAGFTLAFLGWIEAPAAREAVPVQLAQAVAAPALPDDLKSQLDNDVRQAIARNSGSPSKTIGLAVGYSVSDILRANAAAVAASPALAVSIAQEAVKVAADSLGMTDATLVQIALQVASRAARAAPTASASIFVAVAQALPPIEQTLYNQILIAQAIDDAVPNAQLTAAVSALTTAQNAPTRITTLIPLLTVLAHQQNGQRNEEENENGEAEEHEHENEVSPH